MIIAYHTALYYWMTPDAHPWYLYLILPALWWPVSFTLRRHINKIWFLLMSLAVFTAYYAALNLILTPDYFWTIYILYPEAWGGDGSIFRKARKILCHVFVGGCGHDSVLFACKLYNVAACNLGDIPVVCYSVVASFRVFLSLEKKAERK